MKLLKPLDINKILGKEDERVIENKTLSDMYEQIKKAEEDCIRNEKMYRTLRVNFRISNCYYISIVGGIYGYKLTF